VSGAGASGLGEGDHDFDDHLHTAMQAKLVSPHVCGSASEGYVLAAH
jgi:hypothetical protein